MFHVERMKPEDFPFAVHLSNTMNWNMSVEDFELAVMLESEGCFILLQDTKRIGIATTVSFGKVGWFGNLVVREEYRRKGVGDLLLKHAADYLKCKGVDTIGLYAYTHLIGFYEHFGFKLDEAFSVLKGKPVSSTATTPSEIIQGYNVPAVIAFDSLCFGASRARLLEPILLNAKNTCFVFADGKNVKGYVTSRVYDKMATIGPLACIPDAVDDAKLLLGNVLNKLVGFKVFMCVPRKETVLLNLLFAAGFQEDFRVSRMYLGPKATAKCIYIPESLERG